MASEEPPYDTPRGRLFPVVCTAEVPVKVINDFLEATAEKMSDDCKESFMVIVDDLSKTYDEITEAPVIQIAGYPFRYRQPDAVFRMMIQHVKRTGSDINWEYMVILDERSSRDGTALLGCVFGETGSTMTMRAPFAEADYLLLADVGKGLMSDFAFAADWSEDGVYTSKVYEEWFLAQCRGSNRNAPSAPETEVSTTGLQSGS